MLVEVIHAELCIYTSFFKNYGNILLLWTEWILQAPFIPLNNLIEFPYGICKTSVSSVSYSPVFPGPDFPAQYNKSVLCMPSNIAAE